MINKKFGKWTVLNQIKTEKLGKHYECICECGNILIVAGTTLRAGKSAQCRDCMYNERFAPGRLIGQKFGKWTVTRYLGVRNRCNFYESRCECGTIGNHYGSDLRAGKSTMCYICHNQANAQKNMKHGMHREKIYKVWQSMLARCNNPNCSAYKHYGARGIKVSEEWKSFNNFYKDMGQPDEGLTLDRINNDGNYEKANCRWVTHKENCNNRGIYNQGKKRKSKYNP